MTLTATEPAAVMVALRRIVRHLRLADREIEAASRVSAAQLFVLHTLVDSRSMSLAEVAERSLTDHSSVSTLSRGWSSAGWCPGGPQPPIAVASSYASPPPGAGWSRPRRRCPSRGSSRRSARCRPHAAPRWCPCWRVLLPPSAPTRSRHVCCSRTSNSRGVRRSSDPVVARGPLLVRRTLPAGGRGMLALAASEALEI